MRPAVLSGPGLHTTAFYMAFFMALGVHAPFWPLWLSAWGLTAAEVATFVAVGTGVRVVAGFAIPALADRLDRRRRVVAACGTVAALAFVAHLWIDTKAPLLAATVLVGAALAGIGPIAEALGVAAARVFAFPYAQTRGLGSVGFLVGNLAVGALLAWSGPNLALWWIVACLVLVVALVARHPGGGRVVGQTPPSLREIAALVANPVFALFIAVAAFTQASHAVFFALASVHWASRGIGTATIGGLWAISVAAEVVFMLALGAWSVARLGPVGAMAASGAVGVLRWSAMAFDPPVWMLWPLQATHAFTFALGHLGAVAFIARAVPPRLGASAQGAMAALATGAMLFLAMALAAALYPAFGAGTYAIGAALSAIGLALSARLTARWRGETLSA